MLSDIEDSKIMESDEDPEIAAFAKENIKELLEKVKIYIMRLN